MFMDALRHPDLVSLSREGRRLFDAVLAAEQAAAAIAHRRHRTLVDLLVEAEDRASLVEVATTDGGRRLGIPVVGADHVVVDGIAISLAHVVAVDLEPGGRR